MRKEGQSKVESVSPGQKDAARSVGNAGGTISKQSSDSEEEISAKEKEDESKLGKSE